MTEKPLTLYEAARKMGVIFEEEATPLEKDVEVNGIKLSYLDWGNEDKQTMLLLHGRTNSAHTWDFTSLAFHASYHVIALNQRGHGDSDWHKDGDYSLNTNIPDIEAFVKKLGLNNIILVGHSMGARNSMVFASRNPDLVSKLVLVDMAPETVRDELDTIRGWRRLPERADTFDEFIDAALAINPRRTREQLKGSLSHQLRLYPDGKWSWKWDQALRTADTNGWGPKILWEHVEKIITPTLLVLGSESHLISPEIANKMGSKIDDFKWEYVEGAGHQVPGDRPAGFQEIVRNFLNQ
tara:strand:+ start:745 stop:1632 length:888 start_codon:yes stop_codon:yes gene_type:complete